MEILPFVIFWFLFGLFGLHVLVIRTDFEPPVGRAWIPGLLIALAGPLGLLASFVVSKRRF